MDPPGMHTHTNTSKNFYIHLLHQANKKASRKREWCILRTLEMHDQHKMPTRKTLKLQGIITRDKIQEQKA